MAIPQNAPAEEEKEDWLITYADAITLLMAFFVMLLTFADYDIPSFEEAAAAIKSNLTGRPETSPVQLLKIDVEDVVYNMQADQVAKVEIDTKGIVIELASGAFYKPGSAEIREEAVPVLEKMTQTLLAPRYQTYVVDVEGHTDDEPIATERYPSNWELSAGRASQVVRFLAGQGMEPFRMKATGFADTKPKAPNRDEQGNPVVENQALNRRVVIRVYPMNLNQKDEFLRKVDEQKLLQETAAADAQATGQPAPQQETPDAQQATPDAQQAPLPQEAAPQAAPEAGTQPAPAQ